MDGISDMGFFVLLARQASLTAAARELGITTPSVSKRLSQLEARLGVRLLNRTTRRVSLTAEGELYLADGARILSDMTELEQRVSSSREAPAGLLRVNASFGFGRARIAPAITDFMAHYPDIEVLLHLTDRPVNLADQAFDVGIRFGELPDARLHAKLLLKNQRIVCAAPSYLDAHGGPTIPHDLVHHACLVLRENDSAYGNWNFSRGKKNETVKVRGPLSSNDGAVVLEWALKGCGIAIRSEWEIVPFLKDGRLQQVLPEWSLPPSDVYAVFQEAHRLSAKVRVFIDFLQARFRN